MYRTIDDKQKAKLDALGVRWSTNVSKQDIDAHRALMLEIYNESRKAFLPSKHLPEEETLFDDMFSLFLEDFQPETQTLSDFMQRVIAKMRENAGLNKNAEFQTNVPLHINEDIMQASDTDLYSEGWFYEISSQILQFAENHREENAPKLSDYRLFYTAGLIEYCQRMANTAEQPKFQHERDILISMKFPFSDYCLNEVCRSIADLYLARLKKYGDVSNMCSEEQAKNKIPLPIPADVGVCYLERNEQRLITEKMYQEKLQVYDTEMRKLFKKPMT